MGNNSFCQQSRLMTNEALFDFIRERADMFVIASIIDSLCVRRCLFLGMNRQGYSDFLR